MNIDQAQQLKRAIRQLVRAEVAHSWKGSQPREDHEIIDADLKSAKTRVGVMIARLIDGKKS